MHTDPLLALVLAGVYSVVALCVVALILTKLEQTSRNARLLALADGLWNLGVGAACVIALTVIIAAAVHGGMR